LFLLCSLLALQQVFGAQDAPGTSNTTRYGKPMFIDIHHHYFDAIAANFFKQESLFSINAPIPVNASMHLAWANASDVRTMIVCLPITSFVNFSDPDGFANETQAAAYGQYQYVASDPLRFGSIAPLPLPFVNHTLDAINYAYTLPIPADGFEVSSQANGIYIGDPSTAAVWARLSQLNATVFVHPANPIAHPAISSPDASLALYEWVFDTTRAIYNLFHTGSFVLYPNIKWVFAHTGGTFPYLNGRLSSHLTPASPTNGNGLNSTELARILGNRTYAEIIKSLYWDTTIANDGHFYELRDMGVDWKKVMVGSDYPWYTSMSNAAKTSGLLDAEGVDRVRYHNALQLFPRLKQEYKNAGLLD